MNINDYLIDHEGRNWSDLLPGWAELLPSSFTVWLVNRFGELILVLDDGSVHFFDIGAGALERIADSREQFIQKIDIGENANNWLAIPLVDKCVAAGMTLGPDRCYCYKIPPVLGGSYTVENVSTVSMAENYAALADMWRQTRDLPDGTRVRLVIKH